MLTKKEQEERDEMINDKIRVEILEENREEVNEND